MFVKKLFEIKNKFGVHARPSASFVKLATCFDSDIKVECNNTCVNGKSILGLLTLGAGKGKYITIMADGNDANEAIEKLGELVKAGFNEE